MLIICIIAVFKNISERLKTILIKKINSNEGFKAFNGKYCKNNFLKAINLF